MISYENLKEIVEEYKQKIISGGFLVLMFLIGFGSGNVWGPDQKGRDKQQYTNYTTNQTQNKAVSKEGDKPPEPAVETETEEASKPADPNDCTKIKGNIGNGTKIYHVPGGSFYERTQAEMCFATEAEAQSAGFTKSKR